MNKRIVLVMIAILATVITTAAAGRFAVKFVMSAAITAPSAQPYIDMGKFYLTSHNILSARDQFKLAVETEPANQEANFLYGVTRIAAVAEDGQTLNTTGLDSVREIFELAGVVFSKYGLYESVYTLPEQLPPGTPRTGAVFDFLKTKLMPEVDGAISNLETVSSPGFTSVFNPTSLGKDSGVVLTADYADALVTKALLHSLKSNLELVLVYGPDVYLPNIQSAPQELMTYKQLFQDSAFLTPKEAARLETARVSLISFIDTYSLAAQYLLARSGSANHLFVVDVPLTNEVVTVEALSLNDFKKALAEVKASLNGPILSSYAPKLEPNFRYVDLSRFYNSANPINLREKLVNCSTGVVFPDPTLNGLFPLGLTGYEQLVNDYGTDVLGVACMGREAPLITVIPDKVFAMDPSSPYSPVEPISIRNTGTAPLNIFAINLQGSKSADFTLGYGTCGSNFPLIIYPGGSCSVTVDLKHPVSGGMRAAELIISSNDSSHQTTTIPVQGWGQSQAPIVPAVFTLLSGDQPRALIADPSTSGTAYLAIYRYNSYGPPYYNGSGVYKSTNGGSTWSQMKTGIVLDGGIGDPYVNTLAMNPNNSQSLVVSTGTGVYRSLNGGASWSLASNLTSSISKFAYAPSSAATIYGIDYSFLYRSSDSGASWSNIATVPSSSTSLVVDPTSSTTLYVGGSNGVYKTTNSGLTWLPVNSGLSSTYIYDLKSISSTLYVATSNGLYKSTDGASSWTNIPVNGSYNYVQGIAADPALIQTFYAFSYNGIFKTIDGGATWNPLLDCQGVSNISYLSVSPLDSKIYAAGTRYVYTPTYTSYTDIYKFSTATAPLPPTYSLNILRNGTGSGSVQYSGYAMMNYNYYSMVFIPPTTCSGTGPCGGPFYENAEITITAKPDPGSVFIGWNGCDSASGAECKVSLWGPQTVTATFNLDTKPLVVIASPPGGTYATPLEVNLAASKTATIYYTLDGSAPNATSLKYSAPILISQDWSTTLKYVAIDPFGASSAVGTENYIVLSANTKLTVQTNGTGSGQVASNVGGISCSSGGTGICSGTYSSGAPVTLTVTTSPDSAFNGWAGDCSGFGPCIFAMLTNKTAIAQFGLGPADQGPKAKIGITGYNSVNDAYSAAGANAEILAVTGAHLMGNLIMDQIKNITLKGSYNPFFSRTTSNPTLLQGTLTIQNGSLKVDGVYIRP